MKCASHGVKYNVSKWKLAKDKFKAVNLHAKFNTRKYEINDTYRKQRAVTATNSLQVAISKLSESESECKCLTCNQKPTGSQFSLPHEPN